MCKDLIIIGAGGHTRSLLNLIDTDNYEISGIYDDSYTTERRELINSYLLVGSINSIPSDSYVVLSIGQNKERKKFFLRFKDQILTDNLIHKNAFIENNVEMGISNQLMANVYINSNVILGDNNIINSNAVLEHEVHIGSHNHVSVGSKICGRVNIGDNCFIGANVVIIDKLHICDNVTIGAGAVVIADIKESGVYAGNPIKRIK